MAEMAPACLGFVLVPRIHIEDFFLRPPVKKAIILLLYLADIPEVLKDALAH